MTTICKYCIPFVNRTSIYQNKKNSLFFDEKLYGYQFRSRSNQTSFILEFAFSVRIIFKGIYIWFFSNLE